MNKATIALMKKGFFKVTSENEELISSIFHGYADSEETEYYYIRIVDEKDGDFVVATFSPSREEFSVFFITGDEEYMGAGEDFIEFDDNTKTLAEAESRYKDFVEGDSEFKTVKFVKEAYIGE